MGDTLQELRALDRGAAVEKLAEVDRKIEEYVELRGALRAVLLEPTLPEALLDVRETARRLNMSEEWVRVNGQKLDIEAHISEGVYRYDPARVDALRERRRPRQDPGGADGVEARVARRLRGGRNGE